VTGNALAQVQRVHKPADLWGITFCTRWFWGFYYYVHPLILRPRALFYKNRLHLQIQIPNACPGWLCFMDQFTKNIYQYGISSEWMSGLIYTFYLILWGGCWLVRLLLFLKRKYIPYMDNYNLLLIIKPRVIMARVWYLIGKVVHEVTCSYI